MSNLEIFLEEFFEEGGYKNFLEGLANTSTIAIFGLIIGFLLGCVIATVKIVPGKNPILRILQVVCDVYVTLFRGTPMVVQLLLMHFGLFPMLGINMDSVTEAQIIFGMNSAAYMSEILRGGINAVKWPDADAIVAEIAEKLPVLKQGGGFIFSSDHSIPNDVSLENMRLIMEKVKELGAYN